MERESAPSLITMTSPRARPDRAGRSSRAWNLWVPHSCPNRFEGTPGRAGLGVPRGGVRPGEVSNPWSRRHHPACAASSGAHGGVRRPSRPWPPPRPRWPRRGRVTSVVPGADVVMDRGFDVPAHAGRRCGRGSSSSARSAAGGTSRGRSNASYPAPAGPPGRSRQRWQGLARRRRDPRLRRTRRSTSRRSRSSRPDRRAATSSTGPSAAGCSVSWAITLTPDRTPGTRVHLRLRLGPVRRVWLAETSRGALRRAHHRGHGGRPARASPRARADRPQLSRSSSRTTTESPSSLPIRLPDLGLHRQLVGAVAQRHERALERLAVEGAAHLDQPAGAEELGRPGHHHVGPAALRRALAQLGA